MGRETKILLALLATLAGVLLGVLSIKLLVPRPPVGAGPDVTIELASAGANELVEPPTLSPPTRLPPLGPDIPPATPTAANSSLFEADPPARYPAGQTAQQDGLGRPADDLLPPPVSPDALPDVATVEPPVVTRQDPFVAQATLQVPLPQPDPAAAAPQQQEPESSATGAAYVAAAGDSWWELAERAYGDGRLYRALFAWNRVINPRVSLAPGTRLEIPPRSKLEAAWPRLMPPQ